MLFSHGQWCENNKNWCGNIISLKTPTYSFIKNHLPSSCTFGHIFTKKKKKNLRSLFRSKFGAKKLSCYEWLQEDAYNTWLLTQLSMNDCYNWAWMSTTTIEHEWLLPQLSMNDYYHYWLLYWVNSALESLYIYVVSIL